MILSLWSTVNSKVNRGINRNLVFYQHQGMKMTSTTSSRQIMKCCQWKKVSQILALVAQLRKKENHCSPTRMGGYCCCSSFREIDRWTKLSVPLALEINSKWADSTVSASIFVRKLVGFALRQLPQVPITELLCIILSVVSQSCKAACASTSIFALMWWRGPAYFAIVAIALAIHRERGDTVEDGKSEDYGHGAGHGAYE